jgi:hypothetical protein
MRAHRFVKFGNDGPPLHAAVVANGGVSYTLQAQTQLQIGGRHEGVLSRLRRDDRAGCNRGDCSQQSAGAGRPGICHAPLHACWRLRLPAAGDTLERAISTFA